MFLADVFDPEVVDNEGKPNWAPLVFSQAGSGLALGVAMLL
jgi:hypothetical protein